MAFQQYRFKNDLDYMPSNQVYRLREGWFCRVNGKEFGPWPNYESARESLATETRRAADTAID